MTLHSSYFYISRAKYKRSYFTRHPFTVTIKGNTPDTFTLEGMTSTTKTVEVGFYRVHVKQQSGYLLYATENDYEGYVTTKNGLIISFTDNL